ncbi:MAG TPA: hypothetical protein VHZ33_28690 [Trebonia sp.]|jgi:hypothetical protein|nr:hypothetical protein [Trebonia sp.]
MSESGAGPGAFAKAFDARARQVVAAWQRSPTNKAWRTGVVLLNADQLTLLPKTGFPSGQTKIAFVTGNLVVAGRLPAGPKNGTVAWAGGGTATVPLLTAAQALTPLTKSSPCPAGAGACGHLTVTGAKPATLTVATSRGEATVPAWAFTVKELSFPIIQSALAPSGYLLLPDSSAFALTKDDGFGGAGGASVSANGRELTVQFTTGVCIDKWGGLQYATGSAVVIGSWTQAANTNTPCAAMAVMRSATVRLARPLGDRVLLDAGTGLPVVLTQPTLPG